VVDARYHLTADTASTEDLIPAFQIRQTDHTKAREAAIKKLDGTIDANVLQKTGWVQLGVSTRSAALSLQIVQRLIDEVNRFNQATRRSHAVAERQFTEKRLDEVRGELREAEDSLDAFEASNREYRSSSRLTSQHERLAREVSRRSGVYLE